MAPIPALNFAILENADPSFSHLKLVQRSLTSKVGSGSFCVVRWDMSRDGEAVEVSLGFS